MASGVNFGLQQYSSFSPPSLGGCLVWLDAADSNTITGSPVTQWKDKSGRGSNAVTGIGSVTAGALVNSRTTLRFGYNQTLHLSNFTSPSSQSSIFAVFKPVTSNTPTAGTGYFLFSRVSDNFLSYANTNQQFAAFQNGVAGRSYLLVMGQGGERNWGNLSTTAFSSTSNLVTIAGNSYASWNGTSLPLVSTSAVVNSSTAAAPYQICCTRSLGDVFTYDLGELIVYDGTLTLGEIQQVEGYLAPKWGFTLPVGHPYRDAAPAMRLFQTADILAMTPHLWLDAADSTTITGSPVTQWSDKSGRGCNAVTGLGSVVAGGTINSLGTLRFGYEQTLNISNLSFSSQQTSLIAVFKGITKNPNPSAGTGYFLFSRVADNFSSYANTNQQLAAYQNVVAGYSYLFVMGPGGERNWGTLPTNTFYDTVNLVTILGSISASRNGTTLVPNSSTSVTNSSTAAATYRICCTRAFGDVGTFDLGELIVFNGELGARQAEKLIGYLGTKWDQTLTTGTIFSSLPVTVPLFVPTTLANCALWLDGMDSTTITIASSVVTDWTDKSGNGRTASSSSTPSSPTRSTDGVDFNGSTYLTTLYSAVPTAETVFVVATWTGTTNVNYALLGSTLGNGRGYYINQTAGVPTIRWDKNGVNGYAQTSGVTKDVRFMSSGVFTGSAGTTGLNGGAQSTSVAFSFSGTGITRIGAAGGFPGDPYLGTINEILVYSVALTATQRQQVEGYLAWKWGVQKNLPSTHPYYNFRP